MPEYFVALFMQLANITSSQLAEKYITQISDSLELTLTTDESKLFFTYAPNYIKAPKSSFYLKMFDWNKNYRHLSLVQRIKSLQSLTDDREVENRLSAYLRAVLIVSSDKNKQNIVQVLPNKLTELV